MTQKEAYALAGKIAKQFPMFDVVIGFNNVIHGEPKVGNHPTLFTNAVPTGEFYVHIDTAKDCHDHCVYIESVEQFNEWKMRIAA